MVRRKGFKTMVKTFDTRTDAKKWARAVERKLDKLVTQLPAFEELDKDTAVAWHPATGFLIDEWQDKLIEYCTDRDRPYFFAINNWGMPICIFDATTQEEWHEIMKKER